MPGRTSRPAASDCELPPLLCLLQCVYLMSGQASAQLIIVAQRKLETQLDGLKIKYVKVDGMGAPLPPDWRAHQPSSVVAH